MCAHPKTKGLLAGAEELPADGLHPIHGAVLVRELCGVLDARDLAVEALVEDDAPIFRHLQLGVLRVARVDVVAPALSSSAVLHVTDARDDLLSLLVVLRGYMIQLPLDRALQRRCIRTSGVESLSAFFISAYLSSLRRASPFAPDP